MIAPDGTPVIFQQIPTAAILPDVKLAICAGSYIDLGVLKQDLEKANQGPHVVDKGRLIIDRNAVIITDDLKKREQTQNLPDRIGSTGTGTGAAVAARINRETDVVFAKDVAELKPFCGDVSSALRSSLDCQERILIEGTQGFGLSPIHSGFYPYATSRDTTAAGFLAETGLSPLDVDDITLTLRAFPIRVAGNSGPLDKETSWDMLSEEGRHNIHITEKTSVTHKTRRVAKFSPSLPLSAIRANNPTRIVLNHIDYICSRNSQDFDSMVYKFISTVETNLNKKVSLLGFSPKDVIANEITK